MSNIEYGTGAQRSTLALVALILSCLFFLPLVPLVGAILGIVALRRISSRPGTRGKGLAIAAIPTGFVVTLLIQVMVAGGMVSYLAFRSKAQSEMLEARERYERAMRRDRQEMERQEKERERMRRELLRGRGQGQPAEQDQR